MSKKGERYRTPKGVDEGMYPTPERFAKELEEHGAKTYKYHGTLWVKGGAFSTAIIDEILRRCKNNESVVIVVTGPPGSGKTYFAMRFGQKLDKLFHINDTPAPPPDKDSSQLAFGREHLTYLTGARSPLKRDQVVALDEGHFGVGARSWQKADQQDLTNYIAAIRSKGFILMIIALHTEMVDKLLRNFVVNYEFYVTKRGEAIIYRKFFPAHATKPYKKRLGKMQLLMPDEELCNGNSCLRCVELHKSPEHRCETMRAIYERRKEEFLNEQGEKKEEESQDGQLSLEELYMAHIYSLKEEIKWMPSSGFISHIWIQFIIERDFGEHVGEAKCRALAKKTVLKYPDIVDHRK